MENAQNLCYNINKNFVKNRKFLFYKLKEENKYGFGNTKK